MEQYNFSTINGVVIGTLSVPASCNMKSLFEIAKVLQTLHGQSVSVTNVTEEA